ncbi:MAG: hypothetical protein AB7K09_04595 [Planctomycetota bacterium]
MSKGKKNKNKQSKKQSAVNPAVTTPPATDSTPAAAAAVPDAKAADHTHGHAHAGGDRWLDKPANVWRLFIAFAVISVIVFALDIVVMLTRPAATDAAHGTDAAHAGHLHSHASALWPFEGWFGFYAVYGFIACTVLVLVSTQMRKVVKRNEDYYDA